MFVAADGDEMLLLQFCDAFAGFGLGDLLEAVADVLLLLVGGLQRIMLI